MVVVDKHFVNAGKKRGLEVWRIKKFDLEVVPQEQFGNFFTGDSYIVLSTKSTSEWNVHFWLGSETSTDEKGVAAIKTVELDDSLGGLPVQYREVQDHESALFLSYFKNGIKYLKGGNASGFNHVVSEFKDWKPRLYHVKGKRNVRCTQGAGRLERVKGVNQAKSIRDQERAGRPKIHVLDQEWNTSDVFWREFGGKENAKKIKSAEAGGKDEGFWLGNRQNISLWQVSDSSGSLKVTKVHTGALDPSMLKSDDAFIVDAVAGGVFVWVGKGCTMAERKKAQAYGEQYLKQQKRPAHTQIVRVLEGAEPLCYTQFFATWNGQLKGSSFEPKLYNVSNETGKFLIEQVANFTQEDLDVEDVMILDALNKIYIWIGGGANEAESDEAATIAKQYLEADQVPRHKKAEIEVLHQGKESAGFKKLFPSWNPKLWEKAATDHKNVRRNLFRQNSGQQQAFVFAS